MKKELLIQLLEELPDDTEVCILNINLNEDKADEDGSSSGIYADFDVEIFKKEDVPEDSEPFAALVFYDDSNDN